MNAIMYTIKRTVKEMDASMEEHKDPQIEREISEKEQDASEKEQDTSEKEQDTSGEEYSFLQETIKDEAGGAVQKLKKDLLRTLCLGLAFGIIACFGFYAVKPLMERIFESSPKEVTIPEEEEEEEEDASQQEQQVAQTLDEESFRQMQQEMTATALEASRAVVEITGVTGSQDWMNESYDNKNSVTGLIIADNGQELLIFGKTSVLADAQEIHVIFYDGTSYAASLKKRDGNLGFGIYAVNRAEIQQSTWSQIKTAVLGSSNAVSKGNPVIVIGKQFGYEGGIGFGTVAATRNFVETADGEYRLICTDIAAAADGTGIMVNLDGEVTAVIDQTVSEEDSMNLVTGYGITDIKDIIEKLSNDETIPYIGIQGIDVTEEIASQGIPEGVYVKEVDAESPAMAAGIQAGDIITSIGGEEVKSLTAYHNALMDRDSGDEVRIRGQRRGSGGYVDITFSVTVGSKE